ncbi:hypothetical protein AYL99_10292 [Fonsecaea erecta]|uniref:chitin synthase n=1 Tax=Fonsecaea erecta TaxID=1367422 RepID=A0A178Z6C7_9EURO|nr:hypothetical protein AYL99_10292 [Fonsecaea erecta]OAP55319.1 hypothetical protein AYL99_10292 [Fonsecaea erecta]
MAEHQPLGGPWAISDIVSLALIGPIIVAAFLESFLGIFLPVMIATLPLPRHLTQYFPLLMTSILQEFAFYSFAAMLVIPWLFCVYRLVVVPLGRQKRVKYTLNELTAPKVVVVMPVYKEPPDSLWTALNSVVSCDYPASCIHVFVSFDGDDIDELYLKTIDRLGIPVTMKDFPKSIDVAYNGARVTVSRFPHGGKRHCQKATFLLIDKIYKRYLQEKDDLFILFIDSDCILDPVCIQNFMYDMELRPGSKHNMLAMTGIITSSTKKHSFITLLQDMEYVHGQLFERSVESGCGAVTCLPGALTLLRFSAFRNMARFYFSDKAEECEDLFDYAKTHLGEDRWLTHLFMLGAKQRYQIQLSTSAFCKTEAVQTFRSLLKQRRRWFLGFITNEVCMLTDGRLWRKYPMLCFLRFTTISIRTTALLLLITIIAISSTSTQVDSLPWEFMCISCGLNWLLMFYFAIRLHRWKAALYPMMFMLNPFLNWVYMVYGVFTAGQRTWGGPRADAGAADAKVTPQQAIEHAIATGDDLNIVPETFKPAIEFRRRRTRPSALQPSSSVEGRFFSAEQEPSQLPDNEMASPTPSCINLNTQQHRYEHESLDMSDSDSLSVHTPKWINNFSEDEEKGSRQSRATDMEPRPTSMVTDPQSCMREGHRATRNTVAVVPPMQGPRDLYTVADLRDIRQGTTRNHHIDNRSPLGRNSPLTAVPTEEDFPALDAEEGQDMEDSRKAKRRPSKTQRLRKRSPSPGRMV